MSLVDGMLFDLKLSLSHDYIDKTSMTGEAICHARLPEEPELCVCVCVIFSVVQTQTAPQPQKPYTPMSPVTKDALEKKRGISSENVKHTTEK
jgi:hypothetical protein